RNVDEVGPTAGGEVALVCEETGGTLGMGFIDRPLDRLKSVVIGLAEVAKAGDIKIPEALCRRIFKAGEGRMFHEHIPRAFKGEGIGVSQGAGHLGQNPPVWFGLAWGR